LEISPVKPLTILLIVTQILLFVSPVVGQDETLPDACTEDFLATTIVDARDSITAAPASVQGMLDAIDATAALLAEAKATCSGLAFEGDGDRVLGPIELRAGFYRVTVETAGYFSADLQVLAGECEATSPLGLFNETPTESGVFESLIESSGCTTLIQTTITSEPWTLRIEAVG
jgi:hypothetical protein